MHTYVFFSLVLVLLIPSDALFPYLGGLYPGQDGFSPPKWASANLDKGLDTPVILGNSIGDSSLSQLRKTGKSVPAPGAGVVAMSCVSGLVIWYYYRLILYGNAVSTRYTCLRVYYSL
jgi:hypothetical protein